MSKFEKLLDLLVNENKDEAEKVFHEIVVEKSRQIYEGILAEEDSKDEAEATDESADKDEADEVEEAKNDEDKDADAVEETEESEEEEVDEALAADAGDAPHGTKAEDLPKDSKDVTKELTDEVFHGDVIDDKTIVVKDKEVTDGINAGEEGGKVVLDGDNKTELMDAGEAPLDEDRAEEIEDDINAMGEPKSLEGKEDEKVAIAVKKAIPEIQLFIESLVDSFWDGGRLFYVGAGTSGRLGILDASECPPTYSTDPDMVQGIIAGGDIALKNSVEGAEDNIKNGANSIIKKGIGENDVVLGISANGEASFIHSALKEAKKRGALTGLLMCNSPIRKDYIDYIISVIVGPEVITGSTRMKAGTATKLVLNMITTTAMIKLNKTYGNLMVDLMAVNKKLIDRGIRIIQDVTGVNYNNAEQALLKANKSVKIAIVMIKEDCDIDKATEKLTDADGFLSRVIDK